jgi:hypothetical protein
MRLKFHTPLVDRRGVANGYFDPMLSEAGVVIRLKAIRRLPVRAPRLDMRRAA